MDKLKQFKWALILISCFSKTNFASDFALDDFPDEEQKVQSAQHADICQEHKSFIEFIDNLRFSLPAVIDGKQHNIIPKLLVIRKSCFHFYSLRNNDINIHEIIKQYSATLLSNIADSIVVEPTQKRLETIKFEFYDLALRILNFQSSPEWDNTEILDQETKIQTMWLKKQICDNIITETSAAVKILYSQFHNERLHHHGIYTCSELVKKLLEVINSTGVFFDENNVDRKKYLLVQQNTQKVARAMETIIVEAAYAEENLSFRANALVRAQEISILSETLALHSKCADSQNTGLLLDYEAKIFETLFQAEETNVDYEQINDEHFYLTCNQHETDGIIDFNGLYNQ